MNWIKASERLPDSYDAHEKHIRLDGKKVDGILIEGPDGGLVLEYKEGSIYKIIDELYRVEWLDESETPSTERTFSLQEMIDSFKTGMIEGSPGSTLTTDEATNQYFKDTFGIDLDIK